MWFGKNMQNQHCYRHTTSRQLRAKDDMMGEIEGRINVEKKITYKRI